MQALIARMIVPPTPTAEAVLAAIDERPAGGHSAIWYAPSFGRSTPAMSHHRDRELLARQPRVALISRVRSVRFVTTPFVCNASKIRSLTHGQKEVLQMKCMLLITQGEWFANGNAKERETAMASVVDWWGRQFASGKMVGGQQLQAPETATTVVIERGKHTLLDRPLMEAKEAIGGFGILDVADLEEAIAIVETMPTPDCKVEVRPILERPR
jgi:hypothetical protein